MPLAGTDSGMQALIRRVEVLSASCGALAADVLRCLWTERARLLTRPHAAPPPPPKASERALAEPLHQLAALGFSAALVGHLAGEAR